MNISSEFVHLTFKAGEISLGKQVDGYVSHVESPQCFYVQIAAIEDELYSIGEKIFI